MDLLLIHRIIVSTFLLIYIIKAVLMFVGQDAFQKFAKAIKVPEMIVSSLFLATGVYLLTIMPTYTPLLGIKFALVVASIPLAVIATKKYNKVLMVLSVLCLVMAYGMAEMHRAKAKKLMTGGTESISAVHNGKELFTKKCSQCHGIDGDAQRSDAPKLSESKLDKGGIEHIVRNGKGVMFKFNEKDLSKEQLDAVADYVIKLRN
ncbi:c-type cytochrome [Flammeovirga kamogawensis]|uniref:Cytochrome c n=1 Tax=Flammeovirga kamogawensis TaxID=373891 RepID=A0ABX8GYI6_9BACT|nr:cytochrome c [Flammeovirga kamogawensis]MBB6459071.1 cytochrome c553 [Flammeovirga kamogawensis]QWG08640.1 cytochrome c [Flammeovirga kamogawensis]TRX66933.1 c-type cytochrome [Flammeovirga kamogawensis]